MKGIIGNHLVGVRYFLHSFYPILEVWSCFVLNGVALGFVDLQDDEASTASKTTYGITALQDIYGRTIVAQEGRCNTCTLPKNSLLCN